MDEYEVDCEQVKSCVQRLIWDVEQLLKREQDSDRRIKTIEKIIIQVKWTGIGILGTMVAYAVGLIETIKRLLA